MKVWVKALWLCASVGISTAFTVAADVQLHGKLTQGGLIRGKTLPGNQVWLNQQQLKVTESGQFVFGFGRDAQLDHELKIIGPDKERLLMLSLQNREYDIQHVEGVEQKYVTPPKEVTERIQQDNRNVRSARETFSAQPYFFEQAVKPSEGRISGVYGSQRIFNGQPRNPHYGLDIAAPTGTPVLAAWSGKVLLAEDLYYSGLTLIIDHGLGVSSTYMHLSKFDVQVGEDITQGQKIAEIGATGRVTGPHLDWRINWFQERLDPALLLPAP